MGYYGKLREKDEAIKLRKQGLSYNEIKKKVNVSKDTLSRWCRNVILSPEQLEKLRNNSKLGRDKGRIIGAKKQQQLKQKNIEELYAEGKKSIGKLSKRDKFIAGLGLYIGDGYKNNMGFGFANSDPKTIKFISNWLQDFYDIKTSSMHGQIWIHDNLDEEKAKLFWSNLTKIPVSNFYKSYVSKNKVDSKKIRKQLHEHGVFTIHVSSVKLQRKILGQMARVLS